MQRHGRVVILSYSHFLLDLAVLKRLAKSQQTFN